MKPWLWITDPWATLDHPRDTTLRLIEASLKIGQPVAWADVRSLRWQDGTVRADVAFFDPKKPAFHAHRKKHASQPPVQPMEVTRFSQIHYRVDPPVDLAYLQPLQMLEQVVSRRLVNPARSIALLSEKTIPASLPGLWPRSVVSSTLGILLDFIHSEGIVILKPLHGAQSKGVEKLSVDDSIDTIHEKLSQATEGYTRPALLQQYLPEIMRSGETRLWFIDGQLLACAQKVPARGEFRINMDGGSRLARTTLPARLRPAVRQISQWLIKSQVRLAAVDWIDGMITDFNITSPGLLTGMETLLKKDLAGRIVRKLSSEKSP